MKKNPLDPDFDPVWHEPDFDSLPEEVKAIIERHDDDSEDPYQVCRKIIADLEQIGYTADYDLSGGLIDLKKINNNEHPH